MSLSKALLLVEKREIAALKQRLEDMTAGAFWGLSTTVPKDTQTITPDGNWSLFLAGITVTLDLYKKTPLHELDKALKTAGAWEVITKDIVTAAAKWLHGQGVRA